MPCGTHRARRAARLIGRPRRVFSKSADGAEQPLSAGSPLPGRLTCDHVVTHGRRVDAVFKALADPTRRALLDELFARDGQTLTALEGRLAMTRFGVMKHL